VKGIDIFGFPKKTHKNGNFFIYPPPSHVNLPINQVAILDRVIFAETNKIDSLNYRFLFNSSPPYAEYFGYSGSPVFFTDSTTQEKTVQGVFIQVTRDSTTRIQKSLEACKIKFVTDNIDSLLLKIP
jgi:hypothetical protein